MLIKYYATLRDITKKTEEQINAPVETIGELIDFLCSKYGKSFAKWVSTKDGGFGDLSIFLINGQDCRSIQCLQTSISESDVISIFPPIAGG